MTIKELDWEIEYGNSNLSEYYIENGNQFVLRYDNFDWTEWERKHPTPPPENGVEYDNKAPEYNDWLKLQKSIIFKLPVNYSDICRTYSAYNQHLRKHKLERILNDKETIL